MLMAILMAAAAVDCAGLPNQMAMNQCQQTAVERADAEMNRVWKQARLAMTKADEEARTGGRLGGGGYVQALLASQRAWLVYRDAECTIESYEWKGGTMQPFTEGQCLVQVVRARTGQLNRIITSFKD